MSWIVFAKIPLTMGGLQVALYETQRKYSSNFGTATPNTILSNDCLDHEDVILSCCAGLVRSKPSVGFFRMSCSSQSRAHSILTIIHYLCRLPRSYGSGIPRPHSWPPKGTLTRGRSGRRMCPTSLWQTLGGRFMRLLQLLMALLAFSLWPM